MRLELFSRVLMVPAMLVMLARPAAAQPAARPAAAQPAKPAAAQPAAAQPVPAAAQPAPGDPPARDPDGAASSPASGPGEAMPPAGDPDGAAGSIDSTGRDDAAWQLYHRAFAAAAAGQDGEVRALLAELARAHPGHPAAVRAGVILSLLDTGTGAGPGAVLPPPRDTGAAAIPIDSEQPSNTARAELALFQTIHGMIVGVELCIAGDCDDGVPAFGLAMLGGGIGLGASLAAGRLAPGKRALLNSGTAWGAYNGVLMTIINDPEQAETGVLTIMASHLAGLGVGALIASNAKVSEGQVALANTFGIWSSVTMGLAITLFDGNLDADSSLLAMLLATDAGLGIGGYVASRHPTSRGRTLLIDTGGIVGGLGGLGTAVLIAGDPGDQLTAGATLVGVGIGLAASAYLSRDWDLAVSLPARLTLMPTPGGMAAGIALDL